MLPVTNQHPIIEGILQQYRGAIGPQWHAYRNHVYRVYHLCLPFLNKTDNDTAVAVTAACHDLGIWTHRTFDYLAPSKVLAKEHARMLQLNEYEVGLVILLIDEHHKITKTHDALSNTFRMADWHDLTFGIVGRSYDGAYLKTLRRAFPTAGFHRFLIKMSLKRLFTNPFSPLPMFKW